MRTATILNIISLIFGLLTVALLIATLCERPNRYEQYWQHAKPISLNYHGADLITEAWGGAMVAYKWTGRGYKRIWRRG